MQHVLDIFVGDYRAGSVTNLGSDHNVFVFDPAYLADAERPMLSLGFLNAKGELSAPARPPRVRLPPFFANLLPEGQLRTYLAERAQVNPARDFPLLWLLGEDLPGAVVARHAAGIVAPPYDDAVVAPEVENDPRVLKFSLAGVQLKFSAIREANGGLTIPVHGKGGRWIVKMPSATYANVPENEYTMLAFARRVGIDVPEIGLVNSAEIANMPPEVRSDLGMAMYIKRFDRDGDTRIHIEDFAQVFNQYPAQKYENVSYANMLGGIWRTMGEAQAAEFVRRLVFSIAIGNADMHLKNWSVIYRDGRTPELSPAYDYVSTIAYVPNDKLALTLARTKDWSQISDDRLERFARRAGVPRGIVLNSARDMVDRIRAEWPHLNEQQLLPQRFIAALEQHISRIPLFTRGIGPAVGAGQDGRDEAPPVEIA
ncbi:MAG: HipA domain-containing protein [Candidatus Eremiobacteraeota bacterium]|nr:HipA domain-containing protein [Candidatus Eremiobacteraeota bacterium]